MSNDGFAALPDPPYYAVIFTSQRSATDDDNNDGYSAMANEMENMAKSHPGCIGMESSRNENGFGITVSYWRDEASILDWKSDAKHLVAQQLGKERWYTHYTLRVSKVERQYDGPAGR
jgi:heme-degrading monooxygenase HmoA